jgi:hypothetical protein
MLISVPAAGVDDRVTTNRQKGGLTKVAKKLVFAIVLSLGAAHVASAQSAFTTGSIANSMAAGYPSPYGGGGYYDYVPRFADSHRVQPHERTHSLTVHHVAPLSEPPVRS